MVRAGGERQGAAVPQRGITEGATMILASPDEKSAEALAVEQFGLDEEQRKRLAVRED
jgi:hypothetical protein